MKKRILILSIALIMLSGCNLLNNNKGVDSTPSIKEEKTININKSDLPKDEIVMMDLLGKYGKKIYDEKTYDKVNKKSDGTYFISINNLKDIYSYDISAFSSNCNLDKSGLAFDLDRKVYTNLDASVNPVVLILSCENDNKK